MKEPLLPYPTVTQDEVSYVINQTAVLWSGGGLGEEVTLP